MQAQGLFMLTLKIPSPKLSSIVPLRGREDQSYTDYLAVRFETSSFREEKNLYFENPLSKASIKNKHGKTRDNSVLPFRQDSMT